MQDPAQLQKEASDDLKHALEEYPYSGMLHALYLKALKNQGNFLYPKQLKRTAITVPDRKVLHDWVETEVLTEVEVEEKPALNFEVTEKAPDVKAQPPKPEPEVVEPVAEPIAEKPPVSEPIPEPKPVSKPAVKPVPPLAKPKVEPKRVAKKKDPVKETDLDLSNLPASVRETVLRARKLRQQYGNEEEPKVPPGPIPPVVVNKPEPVVEEEDKSQPEQKDEVIEKPVEPVVESVEEAPLVIEETPLQEADVMPEEQTQSAPEQETAQPEEQVEMPDFELVSNEPIEEKQDEEQDEASLSERHSFLDWLSTAHGEEFNQPAEQPTAIEEETAVEPAELTFEPDFEEKEQSVEPSEKASTERMQELYSSFMDKPKIKFRAPKAEPEINTANLSTSAQSDHITETLAQVYVNQKLYNRAINAYEILRLKYPEKSSFFAGRISDIKKILNEKER